MTARHNKRIYRLKVDIYLPQCCCAVLFSRLPECGSLLQDIPATVQSVIYVVDIYLFKCNHRLHVASFFVKKMPVLNLSLNLFSGLGWVGLGPSVAGWSWIWSEKMDPLRRLSDLNCIPALWDNDVDCFSIYTALLLFRRRRRASCFRIRHCINGARRAISSRRRCCFLSRLTTDDEL